MRNKKVIFLTRTAILLALSIAFQSLTLPQFITGPLINMMLLLAVFTVNIWAGVIIGALTPWIAFTVGILPPLLQSMIPFIMLGNAVIVILFGILKSWNQYAGLVIGAVCKYLVLSTAVRFMVDLPPKVASMMQVPQLLTALAGGVLAIIIARLLAFQGLKSYSELDETEIKEEF